MAWKTIKCPYCGYKKDITVSAEVKKFTSLCSCQKCHKQYWYVTEFGRVSVKKKQKKINENIDNYKRKGQDYKYNIIDINNIN